MQLEPLAGWGPTIATGFFSALSIAVSFGVHGRAIKEHDKKFENVDKKFDDQAEELNARVDGLKNETGSDLTEIREEQRDQWKHINDTRTDVGKIKGHLKLNGA